MKKNKPKLTDKEILEAVKVLKKNNKGIDNYEIEPNFWYRISTLVQMNVIPNTLGKPDRLYIHRLIKLGRLPARDFGNGKKQPLYMVKGQDILNYIQRMYT